jgi:hypothetical protein
VYELERIQKEGEYFVDPKCILEDVEDSFFKGDSKYKMKSNRISRIFNTE